MLRIFVVPATSLRSVVPVSARTLARRIFGVGLALAMTLQFTSSPAAADSGTSGLNRDIPLPPAMAAILAEKQQLATEFAAVREGRSDRTQFEARFAAFLKRMGEDEQRALGVGVVAGLPVTAGGKFASPLSYPLGKYLNVNQTTQLQWFYCGPAAGYSVLSYLGPSTSVYDSLGLSQGNLAIDNYFETDRWTGTPLTGGIKAFPVSMALNRWRQGTDAGYYEPVTFGSVNTAAFTNALQVDIYAGYPLMGNVDEVANQAHLVGHPIATPIQHWIAIYGYGDNGANTSYADSVYGTSFWSWSGDVPAYSGYVTDTLVTKMLVGRGYIW